MNKVFLCEDEIVIREAIRRTINWNDEGFELVGEAGDGERAYPMILEQKPDILITDIRMPFMDGLQLARLVREHLPQTRILILSGYDDFNYAKEAIHIGVEDYMLKPVTGRKLLEALHRVGGKIDEERKQTDYREQYEREHAERMKLERSRYIRGLVGGRKPMSDLIETARTMGISLAASWFQIILAQMITGEKGTGAHSFSAAGRGGESDFNDEIIALAEDAEDIEAYELMGGTVCILLMEESRQELERRREEILSHVHSASGRDAEALCFTAAGKAVDRITEIPFSFRDAAQKFSGRFLEPGSRDYGEGEETGKQPVRQSAGGFSGAGQTQGRKAAEGGRLQAGASAENGGKISQGMSGGNEEGPGPVDVSAFRFWKIDRSVLMNFLRSGATTDISAFTDAMIRDAGAATLNSSIMRQYFMMDIFFTVSAFLTDLKCGDQEIREACGDLGAVTAAATKEDMKQYLEALLSRTMALRDRAARSGSSLLILKAKDFIEKNYADNSLSLTVTADAVGVSPNHLSRIFSAETGTTFVEYLTETRMKNAMRLLDTTALPGSEIALQVGYSDPHYFYYIFRKTQNQTPKEYRARDRRDGAPENAEA